ncbi:uncharacterized protein [Antedon mediterranea]|uniref:uncharacterized protein n=1 Tax=Antedon mediterranea TaxID=105859 RepID=UPI003AF467F9
MADNNLNSDSIRDFLAGNGGKARNSDVVLHFKEYLNYPDPKKKEYYRQRFKECINQVAVKKDENGTKFIVLRKKFREKESVDSDSSPRQRRIGHPHQYEQGPLEKSLNQSITESRWREQIEQREEEKRQADNLRQTAKRERERRLESERKAAAKREEQELRRIQEENMKQQEERLKEKEKQFVDERTQEEFVMASVDMNDSLDNSYTGPSGQTDFLRSKEGERIIEEKTQISSVTDQVQKIDSSFDEEITPQKRNSDLQKISEGISGSDSTLNKDTLSSSESQASIRSTMLNEKERLWILYSAQNELSKLSLLLSENKDLSHSKVCIHLY